MPSGWCGWVGVSVLRVCYCVADTGGCCCNGWWSVREGRCYSVESVTLWRTLTVAAVTVGCPCGRVGIASVLPERTGA